MPEKSKEWQEGYHYGLENIKTEYDYSPMSYKNPYPMERGHNGYSWGTTRRSEWSSGISQAWYDLQQWGVIGDPLEDLREGADIDDDDYIEDEEEDEDN